MKYHQKAIIIPILFLWTCLADAQVITGVVCDKATNLPIPNVYVYLDGTTINTITDASGKFELRTISVLNTKLVLHHLSYQTAIIDNPFRGLSDTLYVEKRVNRMREVVVTGARFTREQKMKAFREQFLGLSKAGKSCTILNEDDIQLIIDSQKRKLLASSDKPIVVVNDYLRYQITFILVDFWVQYGIGGNRIVSLDNDYATRSFIAVTTSFTDLSPDSRKIKKRRDNVYENSSNYFFKSLTNDALEDNNFIVFGKEKSVAFMIPINYREYFSIKDTLSQKLISIIPKTEINTNDTFPTVSYNFPARIDSLTKKNVPNTTNNKTIMWDADPKPLGKIAVLRLKKIQSDIYFMTDSFLVDRYGNTNNIDKISFSGQMGKNRAGDMLPIDYEPTPPETKQMTMTFNGSGTKTIYMSGTSTITIDWGDGSASEKHSLSYINESAWNNFDSKYKYSHSYSATNTCTITITGVDITHLNCFINQLTNLDISNNTELKVLYCVINKLKSLDVSNNVKLTELQCFGNPLTSLNLKKNTALTKLYCGGNLSSLDVSKNTALIDFFCRKNPSLLKLDLSKNNALIRLDCAQNGLKSLLISKNAELTHVDCGNNQLSTNALNALFGMLHSNITPSQKIIYIGNNPGTDTCDQSIATNKGWRMN